MKRQALAHNSDIVIDQIRSIDNQRLTSSAITSLYPYEMGDINSMVNIGMGIKK